MPSPFWIVLKEWQTFYVIVGGAAATLIGLMFVATSLASDRILAQSINQTRLYVSPTIVYLTSVLVAAASMVIPAITQSTLGVLSLLVGLSGLIFWLFVLRLTRTTPVSDWKWNDWIFHVLAPLVSYAVLFAVGALLLAGQTDSIDILPLSMVLLLVSGIRNSWDLALWLASHR